MTETDKKEDPGENTGGPSPGRTGVEVAGECGPGKSGGGKRRRRLLSFSSKMLRRARRREARNAGSLAFRRVEYIIFLYTAFFLAYLICFFFSWLWKILCWPFSWLKPPSAEKIAERNRDSTRPESVAGSPTEGEREGDPV